MRVGGFDDRLFPADPDYAVPPKDGGPFRIRTRGDSRNAAWAVEEFGTGWFQVMALACVYCDHQTDLRCCGAALCRNHLQMHTDIEHVPAGDGRYSAMRKHPEAMSKLRIKPVRTIRGLKPRGRASDVLDVINDVRYATALPDALDPIGDAVRRRLSAGRQLPSWSRFQWVVTDLLARATWPGLLEAIGEHETAEWMRSQTQIRDGAATPLSRRLSGIEARLFQITESRQDDDRCLAVADDLMCPISRNAPYTWDPAYGLLAAAPAWSTLVIKHALSQPGGPDNVDAAVKHTHETAVPILLTALEPA